MDVRPCEQRDHAAIRDIYNHYIAHTVISFEETALTEAEVAERVRAYTQTYPWLVCTDGGEVVGYAYANRWQVRCAYRLCAETTVYLAPGHGTRGYGTALYAQLLPQLQRQGLHTAIAGIALPNDASVRLHERCGFTKVGHFVEVGWKLGRWVDVGYWQRPLQGDADRVGAYD